MSTKLITIQKQNDSIWSSLEAKNIQFIRSVIPEDINESEHIQILTEENNRLNEPEYSL